MGLNISTIIADIGFIALGLLGIFILLNADSDTQSAKRFALTIVVVAFATALAFLILNYFFPASASCYS